MAFLVRRVLSATLPGTDFGYLSLAESPHLLAADHERDAGVLAMVATPASASASTAAAAQMVAEVVWAHTTPSMIVALQTPAMVRARVVVSRTRPPPAGSRRRLTLGGQRVRLDPAAPPPPKRARATLYTTDSM
jgi:hypothetical protein